MNLISFSVLISPHVQNVKIVGSDNYKVTSTLLDHFYTNKPERYRKIIGESFAGSDHKRLCAVRSCAQEKFPSKLLETRCYRKIDFEKFIADMEKIQWGVLKNCGSADKALHVFEVFAMAVVDLHAPLKKKW